MDGDKRMCKGEQRQGRRCSHPVLREIEEMALGQHTRRQLDGLYHHAAFHAVTAVVALGLSDLSDFSVAGVHAHLHTQSGTHYHNQ